MTQAVRDIPGGFQYQRRDDCSIAILHAAGGLYMADAAERAMIDRIEELEAEVAALRKDAERFAWHFSGAKTESKALVEIEMRLLSGDIPSIDEVRAAIDAAIQQHAGG